MDHEKFDQWDEDRRRRREERESRKAERVGRRGPEERQRKERVLHTRISDQLDDTLRRAADDLRLPVSNLVRNVLEDVFTVVESVTGNVEELVEDILDEAQDVGKRLRRRGSQWERDITPRRRGRRGERDDDDPARHAVKREMDDLLDEEPADSPADRERQEFPDVVGWQPLVLNQPQQCADCGRDLIRGDRAYLGTMLTPPTDTVPYLCTECTRARS
jgi:hypothetical protein